MSRRPQPGDPDRREPVHPTERDGQRHQLHHQRQLLAHHPCPAGPGHVLYLKSELTNDRWRIYSDNIAMARWLQSTVQGMLNAETADQSIPVTDATFYKEGDPRYFWTERVEACDEEIALTWYNIGEPLLIHTQPNAEPGRPYGVCTVLIPALGARLTRNGVQAVGQAWPREREGRPFSTCALAFSESWTAAR